MKNNIHSDFRTVRGYQLANREEGRLTPALEDYLEMICRLCRQEGYTRVGKLSEFLNVRPSSASKMISKLAALGYLNYDRYDIIRPTAVGLELGAYLLDRHDTVERFLNLIGSDEPLLETELIEHSLSPATVSDLTLLLEFFDADAAARQNFEGYKTDKNKTP